MEFKKKIPGTKENKNKFQLNLKAGQHWNNINIKYYLIMSLIQDTVCPTPG